MATIAWGRAALRRGGGFVGRQRELAELADLVGGRACVVSVVGVGGIGKTAFVDAFAGLARSGGCTVVRVDGRDVEPSGPALLAELAPKIGADASDLDSVVDRLHRLRAPRVLIIDTFERQRLVDSFLRDQLAPRLDPDDTVVLVGRDRLIRAWFTDPGLAGRIAAIELGPLDEPEALEYLRRQGLDGSDARRAARVACGHPLALSVAAELVRDGRDPSAADATAGSIVEQLALDYLTTVPDPHTRQTLEASSVLRRVTESLMGAILPGAAPSEVVDRIAALPFVDVGPDGLVVHDVIREAIARRLAAVAPDRYQACRRAAWYQLRAEMQAVPISALWRYTADLLYLLEVPELREGFFPSDHQPLGVERARPGDAEAIVAITRAHCGPAEAAALRAWWERAPELFVVCRDDAGDVLGYGITLAASALPPGIARHDPVAAAWESDLRRAVPGTETLFLRRLLDREVGEANCPSRIAFGLDLKRSYMEMRPRLRYLYMCGADPGEFTWCPALGFDHQEELGVTLDGQRFETWRLDMGPESVDGWLARLAAEGMGMADAAADVFRADDRELVLPDGQRCHLTPLEHGVMEVLARRSGRPASRADLLAEVWGFDSDATSNVVDTVVVGLRRKLGEHRDLIETVRGVGYRYRAPRLSP